MVDIIKGKKGLTDEYLVFPLDTDMKNYRLNNIKPIASIFGSDYVDFHTTENQRNGVSVRNIDNLTIKTNASINFNRGDYLVAKKDGKVWRINDITVIDDNKMKEYSIRPSKWTILSLTSK